MDFNLIHMYPAIISVGPGAGEYNSGVTLTTERVWLKYNQFLYSLFYDPRSAVYPANLSKNEVAVVWAEVDDSLKAKFKIIHKETKDFSFENLDRITSGFLSRYKVGSNPNGTPTGGNDRNNNTENPDPGSKNDVEGNKPDASGTGKGGNGGGGGFWEIPPLIWLIGAGYAGMKFIDTTDSIGKIVYGGIGGFCGYQYLKKQKIRIKKPGGILSFLGSVPDTQRLPKRTTL